MASHSSIVFCIYFIFLSKCYAIDDNPKLHIVYMGALPKTQYSPTSHHLNMLQQVFDGSNATNLLIHSYKRSFNGFAAMLTKQQKAKLTEMKGVVSVFPSKTLKTQTTRSWDFIGLPKSVKRRQIVESDVVVGVIDGGIWPESESFRDQGFGPLPKKWKGACVGGVNFTCNRKIIGARFYVENSARDKDGHGSHTASVAAGNSVVGASFYGFAKGDARGGVPSARIAAYKACNSDGCEDAAILAAFDDAIADGVDILSVSIGGDEQENFYEDSIAIGSFHAMARGILTVNSAGNKGIGFASVSSVAPWILTVAASTIDRQFINKVVLGNGTVVIGHAVNTFTTNGTKFPIAKRNDDGKECPRYPYDSADMCECLDSDLVKGKIVLCNTGSVFDAVGKGPIGAIRDETVGSVAFVTSFPSLNLPGLVYDDIRSYTDSTTYPEAEILMSEEIEDHTAPIVAEFSSRGPNELVKEILKPDIAAPGVDILAAYSPAASPSGDPHDKRSTKYNILSGTSVSCPHVTGIAAYLKTFHLGWSPAAIKSAIMTTAKPMTSSNKLDIGEFTYGSGQVNPLKAIDPGLIYDISSQDYLQMLCNLGYDSKKIKQISGKDNLCSQAPNRFLVSNLNYPAFSQISSPRSSFSFRFERTVTNVGIANSTYKATILPNPNINVTVAPSILSFKSLNEKRSFVVTITGGEFLAGTAQISSLVWSDGIHIVRTPIIIYTMY